MNISRMKGPAAFILMGMAALAGFRGKAGAEEPPAPSDALTAVSSKVFNGYRRELLADGSFKPEYYGLGIGSFLTHYPGVLEQSDADFIRDDKINKISYAALAKMIEGPLAAENYLPTGDRKLAGLLIVIYWGRTIGTNAFAGSPIKSILYGPDEDEIDLSNAELLGFNSEGMFGEGLANSVRANILKEVHSGILDAVKDDRYFVIVQAYDFSAAWKVNKNRLLWETRFSLSQRRHDFGKDLPRMAKVAAQYFGQDSHGLVQKPIPEGHVDVGPLKSLGTMQEK
jgi:hypothetical protein